jgi:hypothetical protein
MLHLKEFTGLSWEEFECVMLTRGSKTLETVYDRDYDPNAAPTKIKSGLHNITIPYWNQVVEYDYPTLTKTNWHTTIYSSIPFKTSLGLMGGMALANFHLERLGVIWNADSDLSGWVGSFDMRNICQGGVT